MTNLITRENINQLLVFLVFLFSFFPFICFYPIGSDTQPYYLVFGMILLFAYYRNIEKIRVEIFLLFLLFLVAVALFLISADLKNGIRSLVGYFNISIMVYIFYTILEKHYKLFERLLIASIFIWIFIAIIQAFYDKTFMSSLLYRMAIVNNRGMTSMSPEPTTFGLILLFYIMLVRHSLIKSKLFIYMILILSIVFLSQSSLTIILLLVYISLYILIHSNFKSIILFGIFIVLIYFLMISFEEFRNEIRFIDIFLNLIDNPQKFLQDGSVNDRLAAIFFSFLGFFKSWVMPHSFGYYEMFITSELNFYEFFGVWVTTSNRIMSLSGSIFFELGFYGFLFIFVIARLIYKRYQYNKKLMITNMIFINFLFLMAIPLSLPFVSMYIALLLFRTKNETPHNPQQISVK